MKTLKFALIAVLVAFTMVSLANADDFKSKPKFKKVVNINYERAITNPGLLTAMYQQLNKDEFLSNLSPIWIADVVYDGNIYRIHGTRGQWMRFFRLKGTLPVDTEYKGISTN